MDLAFVPTYSFRHNHPKNRTGAFKIPHLVRKQNLKKECNRRSRLRLRKIELEDDESEDEMRATSTRCVTQEYRKQHPCQSEWVLLEADENEYAYPPCVWYDRLRNWWM